MHAADFFFLLLLLLPYFLGGGAGFGAFLQNAFLTPA